MENRRNKTRLIRLSVQEDELFKNKAKRYSSVSAMVRDAVAQFNEVGTVGKIDALEKLNLLLKKYHNEFSWAGSNLNQVTKQANKLALTDSLTKGYFQESLFPAIQDLNALLLEMKRETDKIYHELLLL